MEIVKKNVVVIGAAGHIGLPFTLLLGNSSYFNVIGYDTDNAKIFNLRNKVFPFHEDGLSDLLFKSKVIFVSDMSWITQKTDYVVIMIGTPVDEEGNPRTDHLFDLINTLQFVNFSDNACIILRSTVAPGTTKVFANLLRTTIKKNVVVSFCPERVAQGSSVEETMKLPQIIGVDHDPYGRTKQFFEDFGVHSIIEMNTTEAEFAKLMTNMYRYVNFALANEFYIHSLQFPEVNIDKAIQGANKDYPRMNLPLPGPNVGGPCLFKDGKFLKGNSSFIGLLDTAFTINESMPGVIFEEARKLNPNIKNVLILGQSFKKNSDDIRNSLSFKLKKICRNRGIAVTMIDPFVNNITGFCADFTDYDAIFVMTPHDLFKMLEKSIFESRLKDKCVIVDPWRVFDKTWKSNSGIYLNVNK